MTKMLIMTFRIKLRTWNLVHLSLNQLAPTYQKFRALGRKMKKLWPSVLRDTLCTPPLSFHCVRYGWDIGCLEILQFCSVLVAALRVFLAGHRLSSITLLTRITFKVKILQLFHAACRLAQSQLVYFILMKNNFNWTRIKYFFSNWRFCLENHHQPV